MANPYLILWCDPSQNKIYSGWQKNSQAQTPVLKQGDDIGVELHWVRASSLTASMQEIVFPPSATIRLAVGRVDAQPVGGTFTMTYGADTTPALTYSMTATEIETALNDLPSITAEGGVTVSKSGNQFRILWNEVGVISTALSANVDMLYPTSQASIVESRAGTTGASRIILFKIKQSAIAATTEFTAVSAPELTSTSIFANTWRISAYPYPKEGVWSITVVKGAASYNTVSLPADASSLQVSSALNALNVEEGSTFSVVKSSDFTWDITAPTSVDAINVTSGLIGFSAMYGVLSMNTAEVEEFLSGETSGQARLEVEVDVAGEIQTIAQVTVNVINDLIDESSFNIVQRETVMPIDSVVRYDTAQALTEAQKLTARQNIDAVSINDVSSAFDLTNIPTVNEKNAMQNSVLPSTSNPFVTMSERNPFDQPLNTTDDVQFNTVTVGTNTVVIDGTSISVSETVDTVTSTLQIQPTGITFADATTQTTAVSPATFLAKADNLSGLASASTARTNLGLGTMAVASAADYLAKADNLSGLASASTARTNIGLGASSAVTFGSVSLNNANTALTSTGIVFPDGTIQTTASSAVGSLYLQKNSNLSDLQSVATARSNLGIGASSDVTFRSGTFQIDPNLGTATTSVNQDGVQIVSHALPDTKTYVGLGGLTVFRSPTDYIDVGYDTLTSGISGIKMLGTEIEKYIKIQEAEEFSSKFTEVGKKETEGFGMWVKDYALNSKCGITIEGVVFPDGSIMTSAETQSTRPPYSIDINAYDWTTSADTTNSSAKNDGTMKTVQSSESSERASGLVKTSTTWSGFRRRWMTFYLDAVVEPTDTAATFALGFFLSESDVTSGALPEFGFYWKPPSGGEVNGRLMFRYKNEYGTYSEVTQEALNSFGKISATYIGTGSIIINPPPIQGSDIIIINDADASTRTGNDYFGMYCSGGSGTGSTGYTVPKLVDVKLLDCSITGASRILSS